jgi:hypothetical protein
VSRRAFAGPVAAALLAVALALVMFAVDPGFFWKDDFQIQYLPGSREVARAWSGGRYPLLTQSSWLSASLAGEYQYGVFSVARTLIELAVWNVPLSVPLSMTARAAALFLVYLAIAAAGAFLLARRYGVRTSLALMVALAAGLNGWTLWWATTWFAGIAGLAWLPWYWLALRSIGGDRWSWLGAAVSLYLILTAGWPYAAVMAGLVTAMVFVEAVVGRRWRTAGVVTGAFVLGCMLAAPAWMSLLEYFSNSTRAGVAGRVGTMWAVPPGAWFGLVLPTFSVPWHTFIGRAPHIAAELSGAFLPLAGLLAALFAIGRRFVRERRAELALAAVVLLLSMLPGADTFRWSFRWLPLLHLALAILGACGLETMLRERRRVAPFAGALLLVSLAASMLLDRNFADTSTLAALLLALTVTWYLLERRERVAAAMPAVLTAASMLALFVVFSPPREVPLWPMDEALRKPSPFDPARTYLSLITAEDVMDIDLSDGRARIGLHPELLPGNAPMYRGLRFVNGYSPITARGLRELFAMDVHGWIVGDGGNRILGVETAPNALLHHMGVDGLVVPAVLLPAHRAVLESRGWKIAGRVANAYVLHRQPALPQRAFASGRAVSVATEHDVSVVVRGRTKATLPVVLLRPDVSASAQQYGRRTILDVRESRNRTELTVRGIEGTGLVVFRRMWLPGWRAELNGKRLRVLCADLLMPAVEIPPGMEGRLVLYYRPTSLILGTLLAALALVSIAAISLWLRASAVKT